MGCIVGKPCDDCNTYTRNWGLDNRDMTRTYVCRVCVIKRKYAFMKDNPEIADMWNQAGFS